MVDFIRQLVEEYDRGHTTAGMVDAAVCRRVLEDLVAVDRTEWLAGGAFRGPLCSTQYTLYVEMNAQTLTVTRVKPGERR